MLATGLLELDLLFSNTHTCTCFLRPKDQKAPRKRRGKTGVRCGDGSCSEVQLWIPLRTTAF